MSFWFWYKTLISYLLRQCRFLHPLYWLVYRNDQWCHRHLRVTEESWNSLRTGDFYTRNFWLGVKKTLPRISYRLLDLYWGIKHFCTAAWNDDDNGAKTHIWTSATTLCAWATESKRQDTKKCLEFCFICFSSSEFRCTEAYHRHEWNFVPGNLAGGIRLTNQHTPQRPYWYWHHSTARLFVGVSRVGIVS